MKGLANLKPRLAAAGALVPGLPEPKSQDGKLGSTARGYNYRWQQESKAFLAANPLCAECDRQGFIELAKEVDHIVPHRGDQRLFWDRSNWQGLCKPCHVQKTGRGE